MVVTEITWWNWWCHKIFRFTPMYDAWKAGSRALLPVDDTVARKQAEEICAKVLSNRKNLLVVERIVRRAYRNRRRYVSHIDWRGDGRYDSCSNALEGIDIRPAEGVAGSFPEKYAFVPELSKPMLWVMLNITGGGIAKFKKKIKWFL